MASNWWPRRELSWDGCYLCRGLQLFSCPQPIDSWCSARFLLICSTSWWLVQLQGSPLHRWPDWIGLQGYQNWRIGLTDSARWTKSSCISLRCPTKAIWNFHLAHLAHRLVQDKVGQNCKQSRRLVVFHFIGQESELPLHFSLIVKQVWSNLSPQ